LAGSGRGIAASIASSAALLRRPAWAKSEVADTVRKVAATAISTRSYPARFFERSRIVAPLGRNCPGMEQFLNFVRTASLEKRPACSVVPRAAFRNCFVAERRPPSRTATPARNDGYADDTYASLMQPTPRGASHDSLTSKNPLCNALPAFAMRFPFCLSPSGNGSHVPNQPTSSPPSACGHRIATIGTFAQAWTQSWSWTQSWAQFAPSAPLSGSSAAASSSLR
jgi:hypothetical protein